LRLIINYSNCLWSQRNCLSMITILECILHVCMINNGCLGSLFRCLLQVNISWSSSWIKIHLHDLYVMIYVGYLQPVFFAELQHCLLRVVLEGFTIEEYNCIMKFSSKYWCFCVSLFISLLIFDSLLLSVRFMFFMFQVSVGLVIFLLLCSFVC